ncbi:hypothetical protein HU200_059154 [Digitaria exilis]|uniref:BTB domain-containing protein n=1 Tax=Digitaria exilis TaxID=1010633 RepID=A0A835ALU1_9POAL|nr:hypothetical protein HU200_059154 [Digitaria exilis]
MELGRTNLTEAVRSVNLLKIDGYCATNVMSDLDYIKSSWNVDGHDWEVRFYPRYGVGYGVHWVALKLFLLGEPQRNNLTANLTARLVDPSRNLDPSEEERLPSTNREALPPLPSSDLPRHYRELLQGQRGADVTFVLDSGDRFPAHKTILAARSPVFMADFFGRMDERRSQFVRIEDMQAAVFKAMLYFIYTDTAPVGDASASLAARLLVAQGEVR